VGVLDEFTESKVPQNLIERVIEKSKIDGCKDLLWLTGLSANMTK